MEINDPISAGNLRINRFPACAIAIVIISCVLVTLAPSFQSFWIDEAMMGLISSSSHFYHQILNCRRWRPGVAPRQSSPALARHLLYGADWKRVYWIASPGDYTIPISSSFPRPIFLSINVPCRNGSGFLVQRPLRPARVL